MFDLNTLLVQYLRNIEPENQDLAEYFKAYQDVVTRFGYTAIIDPGQIKLLGWDLEYRCGAAFANFIDQILIRRLNDFVPDNNQPFILDCGANIGFNSLVYKRQFPKAKIIAFEPDPEFAPLLRRNLERNGAGDVEVVEAAVWIENGLSQWSMEGVDGSHLSGNEANIAKTTTVRTINLAEYLNQPIDLIKMDIEVTEYEVIEHLGKHLNNVKTISLECHLNQNMIAPFSNMLKTLSDAGFRLSINSFGAWRDLIRQPTVLANHYDNYLLVSGWREPTPNVSKLSTWIPASGITPIRDYENNIRLAFDVINTRKKELQDYLEAFVSGEVKKFTLGKQYLHEDGYCWTVFLPGLEPIADTVSEPTRSTLLLFEDSKFLESSHSVHDDIRKLGQGRYSHWDQVLFFSTSDGSDPNTNARTYQIIFLEKEDKINL